MRPRFDIDLDLPPRQRWKNVTHYYQQDQGKSCRIDIFSAWHHGAATLGDDSHARDLAQDVEVDLYGRRGGANTMPPRLEKSLKVFQQRFLEMWPFHYRKGFELGHNYRSRYVMYFY